MMEIGILVELDCEFDVLGRMDRRLGLALKIKGPPSWIVGLFQSFLYELCLGI